MALPSRLMSYLNPILIEYHFQGPIYSILSPKILLNLLQFVFFLTFLGIVWLTFDFEIQFEEYTTVVRVE